MNSVAANTTYENPVFIFDGIVHYGAANMPGCVPLTATLRYADQRHLALCAAIGEQVIPAGAQ